MFLQEGRCVPHVTGARPWPAGRRPGMRGDAPSTAPAAAAALPLEPACAAAARAAACRLPPLGSIPCTRRRQLADACMHALLHAHHLCAAACMNQPPSLTRSLAAGSKASRRAKHVLKPSRSTLLSWRSDPLPRSSAGPPMGLGVLPRRCVSLDWRCLLLPCTFALATSGQQSAGARASWPGSCLPSRACSFAVSCCYRSCVGLLTCGQLQWGRCACSHPLCCCERVGNVPGCMSAALCTSPNACAGRLRALGHTGAVSRQCGLPHSGPPCSAQLPRITGHDAAARGVRQPQMAALP